MKKKYLLLPSFLFALSISGCKTENIEEQEHKHVFSESWSYDRENHWHDALCGDPVVDGKAAHELGDWEVETEPTGDTPGTKFKRCAICDYRLYESIPQKLEFELNEDKTSYAVKRADRNLEGAIVIPGTYNGLPVTRIGEAAFEWCTELTSATLPDSIVTIDDFAFRFCTSMTSVNIPYGVTTLGNQAFDAVKKLKSLTLPDSVTSIGDACF